MSAYWPVVRPYSPISQRAEVGLALGLATVIGVTVSLNLVPVEVLSAPRILVAAIAVPAIVVSIVLWPKWPVILLWTILALASTTTIANYRVSVGNVPVTLLDVAALLMLVAGVVAAALSLPRKRFGASAGALVVFMCLSAMAVIIGLMHSYSLYSIAIDTRVPIYLIGGYIAGSYVLRADHDRRIIALLLWVAAVGIVEQQYLAYRQGVLTLQAGSGLSLVDVRDIGVGVFVAKYGVFWVMQSQRGEPLAMLIARAAVVAAALTASFVSLVRTDWVEMAVGVGVVLIIAARSSMAVTLSAALGAAMSILVIINVAPTLGSLIPEAMARMAALYSSQPGQVDTIALRADETMAAMSNLVTPLDWGVGVGLGLSVTDGIHPFLHNSYVSLLVKQGLIGLVAFAMVTIAVPARSVVRWILGRRVPDRLLVALLAGHLASLLGGFISGHVTVWYYSPILGLTLAWIVQLAKRPAITALAGT